MSGSIESVRAHYNAIGLTERIATALLAIAPADQVLTPSELAPLDHFHTRGALATAELAAAAKVGRSTRALDIGCGIGGPARYLTATFGCAVVGVDLSPAFIDAARYLTERCGLAGNLRFEVGDALHLPVEAGAFDAVFLQHVAMNIEDRARLYAEVRRVLAPGGRFATYDLVLREGETLYPVPWARDASTSFLLTEGATRTALESAGFEVETWRDDTEPALEGFKGAGARPASGLNLGVVMGADFPTLAGNLARNLREGRLGVLTAVVTAP